MHSILYIYLFSNMTKFRNYSGIQVSMDDFFFFFFKNNFIAQTFKKIAAEITRR